MRNVIYSASALCLVAAACTQPMQANAGSSVKLHPLKQFCVNYKMTGKMIKGTSEECSDNYGNKRYEIEHSKVGFGGFSQKQNTHKIYDGDKIKVIDLDKNTVTIATNPAYDDIKESMKNADPKDVSASFIAAIGFIPTDKHKTIAEHDCLVYESPQIGKMCMTPDGVILEQKAMGVGKIATAVSLNSSGDPANYTADKNLPVTEAPDVGSILENLGR